MTSGLRSRVRLWLRDERLLTALCGAAMAVLLGAAACATGLYFVGAQLTFEALIALLALVVVVDRIRLWRGPLLDRPMDWAALAVFAGYLLSLLIRPVTPDAALTQCLVALAGLLWYWCAGHVARSPTALRGAALAVFCSGVLLVVVGALGAAGIVTVPSAFFQDRLGSTLQYGNTLAAWLAVSLIAGVGLTADCVARVDGRRGARVVAAYGAGSALLVVALVATYSRAGWLVAAIGCAVACYGLPPRERIAAAAILAWSALIGVLLSRDAISAFTAAAPGRTIGALLGAAVLGGIGAMAIRWGRRAWRHADWSPGVRALAVGALVVYAGAVGAVLAVVGRHDARHAGGGIVDGSVLTRVGSIGFGNTSVVSRVEMWGDALRLVRLRPLFGYGGGGWEAMYHTVQQTLYWSTQVHDSILQAWVEGGLAAAAGVAALGPLLIWAALRLRRQEPGGALYWTLGIGALALWLHALFDFDLSYPAAAMLLWGIAGALRRGTGAPASIRDASRARAGANLALMGVCSFALLAAAVRIDHAYRLASYAAAELVRGDYVPAYSADRSAVALDPLSASDREDLAQLVLLAAAKTGSAGIYAQAVQGALAAARLDPGDIDVRSGALNTALQARNWTVLQSQGEALLAAFPLDPDVYGAVAADWVQEAQEQLAAGDGAEAARVLGQAAGVGAIYAAAMGRASGAAAEPLKQLSTAALVAEGQADAMLGRWGAAQAALQAAGPNLDPTAAGWLAAVLHAQGRQAAAAAVLAQIGTLGSPDAGVIYTAVLPMMGVAAGSLPAAGPPS